MTDYTNPEHQAAYDAEMARLAGDEPVSTPEAESVEEVEESTVDPVEARMKELEDKLARQEKATKGTKRPASLRNSEGSAKQSD